MLKYFYHFSRGSKNMKYDIKRLTKRAFVIYALVNVFAYVFVHVAYLFANDVVGEIFEYFSYYLSKSVEFLAPPIIATVVYLVYKEYGRQTALITALTISCARVFYTVPYYYIIFIYNYGYDSVESITFSLLATLLVVGLTVIGIVISIGIYLLVMKIICKRTGSAPTCEPTLPTEKSNALDFLARANLPVLVFALSRFAFSFVMEFIDTVSFFIEYTSDYRAMEIITILINFTLLFVLLVASYLISAHIKNALITDGKTEETIENTVEEESIDRFSEQ